MLYHMQIITLIFVSLVAAFTCGTSAAVAVPVGHLQIIASYPHDPHAFTQGLLWHDGFLYESTGLKGRSTLRRVRLSDGAVMQKQALADDYFGEGLARIGDRLIQLTWKAGVGFVYDLDSLERLNSFHYSGQGWGLTYDGERLIMSDGTAVLRFLDPQSLEVVDRQTVTLDGQPLPRLNELEMVRGELWANLYPTDVIARIDVDSGQVIGLIDASGLRARIPALYSPGPLNGIAYDAENDRLLVTGKLWPRLFQVRLVMDRPDQDPAATPSTAHSDDAASMD